MLKFVLVFILTINIANASKGKVIFPMGKAEVQRYLDDVQNIDSKKLGFDPQKVTVRDENKEGSSKVVSRSTSFFVYDVDINNDGKKEYFSIYVGGGSLSTSGILSVVTKNLEVVDYGKIISKNLWNDDSGDLSKLHLWLAAPAVVKRDGKYLIRFMDTKPKTLFTEYLWEKQSFKKVKETTSNTY